MAGGKFVALEAKSCNVRVEGRGTTDVPSQWDSEADQCGHSWNVLLCSSVATWPQTQKRSNQLYYWLGNQTAFLMLLSVPTEPKAHGTWGQWPESGLHWIPSLEPASWEESSASCAITPLQWDREHARQEDTRRQSRPCLQARATVLGLRCVCVELWQSGPQEETCKSLLWLNGAVHGAIPPPFPCEFLLRKWVRRKGRARVLHAEPPRSISGISE